MDNVLILIGGGIGMLAVGLAGGIYIGLRLLQWAVQPEIEDSVDGDGDGGVTTAKAAPPFVLGDPLDDSNESRVRVPQLLA